MRKTKILIADDHQIVRDGISVLLMRYPDEFEIIGEVENGEEVLKFVEKQHPDVVILDLSMPVLDGLETTKILSEKHPFINVLIFSSYAQDKNVVKAMKYGARGILPKNTIREELIQAIRTVAAGKEFISQYIPYASIMKSLREEAEKEEKQRQIRTMLTNRELEILNLVVQGLSNKEIADKLFISVRTVEKHKSNILNKLGLKSVVELVKFAIKNKIVDL